MHLPNCEVYGHRRRNSQLVAPPSECPQKHFYLTQRGAWQASRNDSSEIWKALGPSPQGYCLCFMDTQHTLNRTINLPNTQTNEAKQNKWTISKNYDNNKVTKELDESLDKSERKKSVSFNVNETSAISKQKSTAQKGNKIKNKSIEKNNKTTHESAKKLTKQQEQLEFHKRQKYLKECYTIDKYLKSSKAYTRQLPNTAIKLFYEKLCLETYGRGNTTGNNGFICNDFMKTHNTLPHRMENQPKKYQTYRSALNFGLRTKLDPEERWRRIHRQMIKKLKMNNISIQEIAQGAIDVNQENLEEILKLNINFLKGKQFQRSKSLQNIHKLSNTLGLNDTLKTNKTDLNTTKAATDLKETSSDRISHLKRSKSWGKKQHLFLYRYKNKDGDIQYCRDRHGITCYVDPSFPENEEAFTKFQKKINPIEADDVAPSDRNIDRIRMDNFIKTKQGDAPKHYLIPNCDQPYRPQKYSIKLRKKSMASSQAAQKQ